MESYTEKDYNRALCRKNLDLYSNGNFTATAYEECHDMTFLQVDGISRFWQSDQPVQMVQRMGDVLSGFVHYGIPFCYALVGSRDGIHIYLGTLRSLTDSLQASLRGIFPGIGIHSVQDSPLRSCPRSYGGMITGLPDMRTEDNGSRSEQIESICRGMQSTEFTFAVLAVGASSLAVTLGHERLLDEMGRVFSLINQSVTGGAQGNISAQRQDFTSKDYFDNLEALEKQLQNGMARGMWRMNGYYAANDMASAQRLGNLIRAAYSGQAVRPEPLRILPYNRIREVIENHYLISDPVETLAHPLSSWFSDEMQTQVSLYSYNYQTLLNSDQLAAFCQLPVQEFPGYYLDQYVAFDVAKRIGMQNDPIPLGHVQNAGRGQDIEVTNVYSIEKCDLTRHALIIGITGGGKTNTTKSILNTLWGQASKKDRIPFLVIESAKREYWELRNLKGFEDLVVFTLGAESSTDSIPYRINPFEVVLGLSLQTHIDYLLSTFNAAFDLFAPLPYVLETAVYEVYSDRGWDIVEGTNHYGRTQYPTLTDLYNKVEVVVDRMGYHQEVQSNVKTALQARIHSLMIGGKGAMMDTPRSVPISSLLDRPVVLELEDIGDDETKSFVIGILLVQLYEYRKSLMTKGSKDLSHLLMVEEAHRLLRKIENGENGSRAKSVEFFCNMLAEIRTYGQGILIADQIPTKLAPDTLKNTNLKIVHRTVAAEDRETIGRAMNMSAEQIEYLSSLPRGHAAVYSEGDNRPKCVKFPLVESYYDKDRRSIMREVAQKVAAFAGDYAAPPHHHIGCTYCEHPCQYFDRFQRYLQEHRVNCTMVCETWAKHKYASSALHSFLNASYMQQASIQMLDEHLCLFGLILENASELEPGQRQQVLADYIKWSFLNTDKAN